MSIPKDGSAKPAGRIRDRHIGRVPTDELRPMSDSLPTFRYHEDPLATGSIVSSPNACRRCGRQRGYIYVGPINANDDLDDAI